MNDMSLSNVANNTKYEISTSDKVPNTVYQHLFYSQRIVASNFEILRKNLKLRLKTSTDVYYS